MPSTGEQLPEGTDQIIDGAARTDAGGMSSGSMGAANEGTSLVASGTANDTGGNINAGGRMTSSSTGSANTGSTGTGGVTDKLVGQVKDQVSTLRSQAGDKLRTLADDGKGRTESLLDDFADVINDAARAIEERFGGEYASYANQAAERVTGLTQQLRDKSVDDLLDDTRELVRKSPGLAIGIAAVAGFALMRVLKTGMEGSGFSSGAGGTAGTSGARGSTGTGMADETAGSSGGSDLGGNRGSTPLAGDYAGTRTGVDTTSSGGV